MSRPALVWPSERVAGLRVEARTRKMKLVVTAREVDQWAAAIEAETQLKTLAAPAREAMAKLKTITINGYM